MSRLTQQERDLIAVARLIVGEHEAYEVESGRTIPETYAPPMHPHLVEENGIMVRVRLLNQLRYAVKGIPDEAKD